MAGGRAPGARLAQLEGRHPVLEALRAGRPLRKLVVSRAAARSGALRLVIAEARRHGVPVHEVAPEVLARLATTRTPQGVIAYAAVRPTVDVDALLDTARRRGEAPFLLFLDGIEDPGNLGAILRSADATGVHGVVIPRWRAAGLTPAVAAASAGAVEHVAVASVASLPQAIEQVKRAGLWVVGADPAAAQEIYEPTLRPPIAVVVGREGQGLSRLVRDRCDLLVRIPMYGRVASLNVSVAAALVLYEVRRQMRSAPAPP
ncbi:MAG: 23S rRNA (guanosine(2251)-2'-O)-methyltransferase RlmB [Armatimonadota bacterium]|nr:23S rRNA (guanosine(2251)-2'-O)-methyltransferase RlmB [Armatimonadota bacterium]MDR7485294.1 23S rRNA (guanosine(2251)-2'-O)-methyltransferase RlmB [Armatimonadota bacterium]MDR7533868.1 23S rRNA (guanosine(2251)-2'-O)-methyltransferase RlmB [Armatimonadota bacterium]MDR7537170.1 23S rRNA (guanosine(2251)-2'-O)-methyltransferase RlmB [Armatimonadota bacterium]